MCKINKFEDFISIWRIMYCNHNNYLWSCFQDFMDLPLNSANLALFS